MIKPTRSPLRPIPYSKFKKLLRAEKALRAKSEGAKAEENFVMDCRLEDMCWKWAVDRPITWETVLRRYRKVMALGGFTIHCERDPEGVWFVHSMRDMTGYKLSALELLNEIRKLGLIGPFQAVLR